MRLMDQPERGVLIRTVGRKLRRAKTGLKTGDVIVRLVLGKLSCEAYGWGLKAIAWQARRLGKCCMVEIAASILVVLAVIVLLTFVLSRR